MTTYEQYHQASSIVPNEITRGANTPASAWPAAWTEIDWKTYPRAPLVDVPPTLPLPSRWFSEVLSERRSSRMRGDVEPTFQLLRSIVTHAAGVHPPVDGPDRGARRPYPSAGARFPIEAYLTLSGKGSAESGLFHLGLVEGDTRRVGESLSVGGFLSRIAGHQWVNDAFGALILTSVMGRSAMKYRERAYRFALLEAGHLSQNILLASAAFGLSATPVGGFADVALVNALDLQYSQEVPIYMVVFP